MSTEHAVNTNFGPARIVPNSAQYVYIGDDGAGTRLTIRGVKYSASLHFERQADGTFEPRKDKHGSTHEALYMTRCSDYSRPSDSARRAMVAELTAVVNTWARQNPEALEKAARQDYENSMARVEGKIEEHEQAIKALREEARLLTLAEETRVNFGKVG